MKVMLLFVLCSFLGSGVSFAGKLLDEYEKNNDPSKQSEYKASPKIDFHKSAPTTPTVGPSNGPAGATETSPLYGNKPNDLNNTSGKYGKERGAF